VQENFKLGRALHVGRGKGGLGQVGDAARTHYVMGVFKLPANLCDELTRMVRCFWWGDEDGHRKIHWLAGNAYCC
jgi:hypothetical protein